MYKRQVFIEPILYKAPPSLTAVLALNVPCIALILPEALLYSAPPKSAELASKVFSAILRVSLL